MLDEAMTDPVVQTAKRLTRRAHAHLYWEVYAPLFARAALVLALFLIGTFGGIWEIIGDPWRLIALAITLFFCIRAVLAARRIKRPNLSAARRRVESDSAQLHRPLDTLADRPAIGGERLWDSHLAGVRESVKRLKPSKLRAVIAPRDKYFLRFITPVSLILAIMVGAGFNYERLRRSVLPMWQNGILGQDVRFEAWIDPPDYTGRPPIYFKDGRHVEIPEGSELVTRIYGVRSAPRPKLITQSGRTKFLKLNRLDPKSFESRTILDKSAKAQWRVFNKIQSWKLDVVADQPPVVEIVSTPKADKRDRLKLTYSLEDDYGVEVLELKMRRLSATDGTDLERDETASVAVTLPGSSVKRLNEREALLDLTKHEWAGQKVSAVLAARDGAGQMVTSERVFFTVPDKIFIEPLAKAVIENRRLFLQGKADYAPYKPVSKKALAHQPLFDSYEPQDRLERAPEQIQRAVLLLEALTDKPATIYQDPVLYMGLRHVLGTTRFAREQESLEGIPAQLWKMALRAEFGLLGSALEAMQAAEQSLREGIARRAPQREIDTLFDRYNEAVDRYMEELRKKAVEAGNIAEGGEGGDGRNTDQIEELLKAIEEANRIGDVDGARRALAQLAALLENMQIQLSAGAGQGEGESMPGEMSEELREALEEMADLLGEQRELEYGTDRAGRQSENEAEGENSESGQTQSQGQSSGQGRSGAPEKEALSPGELAAQQKLLEEALAGLNKVLEEGVGPGDEGEAGQGLAEAGPEEGENGAGGDEGEENEDGGNEGGKSAQEALADAARAMLGSREALGAEELAEAGRAQQEAIEALREAGKSLSRAARRQQRTEGQEDGEGEDGNPLGQSNNGIEDENSEVDVDSRDNATRSRELLEELRRRASEQEREQSEREYLERLLKRF